MDYVFPQDKKLSEYWLSPEEASLINIVRRIIWGSVEIKIKNGEIRLIKKTIETYLFDRDNKKGGIK